MTAQPSPGHEPHHRTVLGAVLTAGTAVVRAVGYLRLPREHAALPAVARYAMEVALPTWKLTEPVNEVVYGTRGFDTFGETFLLLAAVISVILIARPREARRGYFGEETALIIGTEALGLVLRSGTGLADPRRLHLFRSR
ncbi:hypothetical protein [Catenulispora subtropica]|uniref:Uncharacterized protein n=1 Tax=Catenulispora subtropica TaxID=450798 RepID=A0ABN2RMH0_9ACTN